jgi:beta-lactamase regulating signal transducer with metallopeptidase domain
MNSIYSWFIERNLTAGTFVGIVVRISVVLAVAWLADAALARGNPRWRVLAWRMSAVAALLVLAVTFCGLAIPLKILPAQAPIQGTPLVEMPFDRSQDDGQQYRNELVTEPQAKVTFDFGAIEAASASRGRANDIAATSGQIDWTWWGLAIWIVGAVLGLTCDGFAWLQLRALRRRSQLVAADIASLGSTIAARLGCRQTFEIRRTRDLNSPCVFGVLRPVILIPEADCGTEQRFALPAILSHEIAHLVGGDVRWHALLRGLARLFWFHPLMWQARSAHLAACDAVCDATAANYIGDAEGYGRSKWPVLPVCGVESKLCTAGCIHPGFRA